MAEKHNHQVPKNPDKWNATEAIITTVVENCSRFGMTRELAGVAVTHVWHYLAAELKWGKGMRRVKKIIQRSYERTKSESVNIETYKCHVAIPDVEN